MLYAFNSAVYNKKENQWEYPGLSSLSEQDMAYLDHYLENFDPEIHIATVSTKHDTGAVFGLYEVRGANEFLVQGHAYSIVNVDPKKRLVVLANPWDTSKNLKLTFRQFKENFDAFRAVRINSAKLLENMERLEKVDD